MAIKGQKFDESRSGNFQLYTGAAKFKVKAINPDQEGLKQLGFKADKAPVYVDDKGTRKVVFHIESIDGKIKSNLAFFIKNVKSDTVFMDNFGKFSKDQTKLKGAVRRPWQGESNLIDFLGNWIDVEKDGELFLSTIDDLVRTGNISEILSLFRDFKDNQFYGLAYVREGKYQGVYSRRTARHWTNSFQYIHKALVEDEKREGDFGPINLSVYNKADFAVRAYDAASAPPTGSTGGFAPPPTTGDASQGATSDAAAGGSDNPW